MAGSTSWLEYFLTLEGLIKCVEFVSVFEESENFLIHCIKYIIQSLFHNCRCSYVGGMA